MKAWIKRTIVKTIKTMAQTAVGVIGSSAVLADINWSVCLSSVLLAGLLCILMNVSQIEE